MKHNILDRDSVLRVLDQFKEDIENSKIENKENVNEILIEFYTKSAVSTIETIKECLSLLTYMSVDLNSEDTNFGK